MDTGNESVADCPRDFSGDWLSQFLDFDAGDKLGTPLPGNNLEPVMKPQPGKGSVEDAIAVDSGFQDLLDWNADIRSLENEAEFAGTSDVPSAQLSFAAIFQEQLEADKLATASDNLEQSGVQSFANIESMPEPGPGNLGISASFFPKTVSPQQLEVQRCGSVVIRHGYPSPSPSTESVDIASESAEHLFNQATCTAEQQFATQDSFDTLTSAPFRNLLDQSLPFIMIQPATVPSYDVSNMAPLPLTTDAFWQLPVTTAPALPTSDAFWQLPTATEPVVPMDALWQSQMLADPDGHLVFANNFQQPIARNDLVDLASSGSYPILNAPVSVQVAVQGETQNTVESNDLKKSVKEPVWGAIQRPTPKLDLVDFLLPAPLEADDYKPPSQDFRRRKYPYVEGRYNIAPAINHNIKGRGCQVPSTGGTYMSTSITSETSNIDGTVSISKDNMRRNADSSMISGNDSQVTSIDGPVGTSNSNTLQVPGISGTSGKRRISAQESKKRSISASQSDAGESEPRATKARKKNKPAGSYTLTGHTIEREFNGQTITSYQCSDGIIRILSGQMLQDALARTEAKKAAGDVEIEQPRKRVKAARKTKTKA
ncbi:hypothetical protein HIM_01614 [Hirsutella minnesotensis 3608]|nr:hypothetical protein HIM_01614 [Hirsutella minnesotensis 3608]